MKTSSLFKSFLTLALIIVGFSASAQIVSPVKWKIDLEKSGDSVGYVIFDATIDEGWHLYSNDLPEGGPIPTSIEWKSLENVKVVGDLEVSPKPHEEVSQIFMLKLGSWSKHATLKQKVEFKSEEYKIEGYVTYMACNDGTCQPPKKELFKFLGTAEVVDTLPAVIAIPSSTQNIQKSKLSKKDYWEPVDNQNVSSENKTLLYIFFGGFIGGLLALLTPCVWPMIPLTVSFFLKKHGSRRRSIVDAIIYGLSIVVIYLLLGIIVTVAYGPGKLNELSTDAVFNLIFFALLVVFAISFFGAFELTLPSKWTNKMDAAAERTTGLVSIFFMAFTLALVSFSCTGPIIGTLLVEAVSLGDMTGPIVGMGSFALALAIPFAIFAIFPTWLKELPKSGGWLNTVKVVLGFIELALSVKFLSVADLAYGWRILDREVFIVLWVAIFALLGIYLLGKIRFTNDSKVEKIGVFRFFLALISLSFSLYLLPGLWGAPLRAVSAFVPPLSTQDFNLYSTGHSIVYDDFDEGMEAAKEMKKPIFLDFSGYGCVNCRKMEMAVLDKENVRSYLKDNYVSITLMVDDRKKLEKPVEVTENGEKIELETYGELWSFLQRYKFGANSQPYYVVLNNEGELLSGPVFYDEDVDHFMEFLKKGVDKYSDK